MNDTEKAVAQKIGERLQAARKLKGLSQAQLGSLRGITFQQIQKYEKGSNNISAAKLQLLANDLGVTVQYFYGVADVTMPEVPTLRRKYLHLIQNLKHIEQQNPAVFLAVCNMVAGLTKPEARSI